MKNSICIILGACGLALSLAQAGASVIVDFEELHHNDSGATVQSYLANYGITVTTPSQLLGLDDRLMVFPPPSTPIVQASSGHMFLAATGPTMSQSSYTLEFSTPLSEFAFTQIWHTGNNSGTVYPGWLATVYEGSTVIAQVGPGTSTYSVYPPTSIPEKTFSFMGSGITSVRIDSYPNNFAAFGSVFIDDVTMTPVPEPATWIAGLLLLLPFTSRVSRLLRRDAR